MNRVIPAAQPTANLFATIVNPIHAELVTPDDANDLAQPSYISIAAVGDVKVTTLGGETLVIPSGTIPVGKILELWVKRVWATGTTATGIVAYWF